MAIRTSISTYTCQNASNVRETCLTTVYWTRWMVKLKGRGGEPNKLTNGFHCQASHFCCPEHGYITLTLPWDGAPPRKGPPGGEKPRKRDSTLSGHWMGHLLSYSLSGGHDGAMLPINPRGLNGPLTSHFTFSSHVYLSLNTPTHYWSPMPN